MLTKEYILKSTRLMQQTLYPPHDYGLPSKKHIIKITKRMRKILKRLEKI